MGERKRRAAKEDTGPCKKWLQHEKHSRQKERGHDRGLLAIFNNKDIPTVKRERETLLI